MTVAQRRRQDVSAFKALISTPGNLTTGFALPGNADCYVSTTSVLAATTKLLDCGTRQLGAKASVANKKNSIGHLERGHTVIKHSGAPGTVSLYIRDGAGRLLKVGG
jgi:hypothetical protein